MDTLKPANRQTKWWIAEFVSHTVGWNFKSFLVKTIFYNAHLITKFSDELKTKQDAILADCGDLQVLLTTLVRETTV